MNFIKKYIINRVSKWSDINQRGWLGFMPRPAGVTVTHDTAMTYSAVWRAVSLISETVAGLPWAILQREIDANGRKKTTPVLTHPVYRLLDTQPNPETDAFAFRQTMLAWALTWGNGYAEIERDGSGRPMALWQIEPGRVTPMRDENGRIVYKINNGMNGDSYIDAADMFHLKGLGFDGLCGYSVISYAARSIGMGIATEQFGADFFSNGAQEGGVLEHPSRLGEAAIAHLKQSLLEATTGKNKLKPLVLEEGMKWTRRTIPPDDAQFLETRKFNTTEIARWYGVPPHKLMEMESATFSNIEHQNIEFVTDAIMAWVKRLEIEANIKLISRAASGRVYTKLKVNALLRGDSAARGEWYTKMSNLGAYSVNDILELEDMNPIGPEGDKHMVQMNLTTLEKVGEQDAVTQKPASNRQTQEAEQDDNAPTAAPGEAPAENSAVRVILVEAFERIVSRETHRIGEALKKYDGDRVGLEKFIDKFNDDHARYMHKALSVPVAAFGIKVDIDQFIDGHAEKTKQVILGAFDTASPVVYDHPNDLVDDVLLRAAT